MRSMRALVLLGLGCSAPGCVQSSAHFDRELAVDESPLDPDIPAATLSCDGLCVQTAPATFTGPSLFWIGAPTALQPCPSATPYLGIEGWINDTAPSSFARECRITPSDRCQGEGLVCAPMPDEDFHVCIHHAAEATCPSDYPERSTMSELGDDATVTLCCQGSPISG